MIILANILQGIAVVLEMIITLMIIVVIARAVISWVSPDPRNPIVRFLVACTDPMLAPLKRFIPPFGMLDITPIVLLFLLYFLKIALVQTLFDYSMAMK